MRSKLFMGLFVVLAVMGGAVLMLRAPIASAQTPTATATATTTATATATATATTAPTATASPTAAPGLAPCPTGASLTVSPPTAAAPTTVTVTLTPANLNIKPGTAGDPTSLHLHYFIDTPATAAGVAVPLGDAKIIHAGTTTQDLGALSAGSHTVAVVLGQFNHTACETRASVTFTVAQAATTATAAPAAPKTGNAGLASDDGARVLVILMAVLAAGGVLGTRMLVARRTR